MAAQLPLDEYGGVLMSAGGRLQRGGNASDRHDTFAQQLAREFRATGLEHELELFSEFSAYVRQSAEFVDEFGGAHAHPEPGSRRYRKRQGLRPDFRVKAGNGHAFLADVKTMSYNRTRYPIPKTLSGSLYFTPPAGAVNQRAKQVHTEYHAKARTVDRIHNKTPEGVIGPLQARLLEYGHVAGFVVGVFGEFSDALEKVITLAVVSGADLHWKRMGATSAAAARAIISHRVHQNLSVAAVRANARMMVRRIGLLAGGEVNIAYNRRQARRSWWRDMLDWYAARRFYEIG